MDDVASELLLRIIGNSPTFALLFYIWWTERADRIRCQERLFDLIERGRGDG